MTLSKHYPIAKITGIIFTRWHCKRPITREIDEAHPARTLIALHLAGEDGLTTQNSFEKSIFRLRSSVSFLQEHHSLDITHQKIIVKSDCRILFTLQTLIAIDDVMIDSSNAVDTGYTSRFSEPGEHDE